MTTHQQVAQAFARKEKANGSRMYTDGTTVYSYGPHYPIARHLDNGVILFNSRDYGTVSTARHKRFVQEAISPEPYIEVNNCSLQPYDVNRTLTDFYAELITTKRKFVRARERKSWRADELRWCIDKTRKLLDAITDDNHIIHQEHYIYVDQSLLTAITNELESIQLIIVAESL